MHARHFLCAGRLLVVQLLIVSCILGCSNARKPPPPPLSPPAAVVATVTHHFGAPLVADRTTRAVDAMAVAQSALAVRVTWSALERMPAGLSPITPTARL